MEIIDGGRKVKLKAEKQLNILKVKVQLVARVEKYKLEQEMAVLSSSVWMAMLYCLCAKMNTG